jgi:hypothetical protein
MSGCVGYDCLGAGQLATAMFNGMDASSAAVRRARHVAFAKLREVQALRLRLQSLREVLPVEGAWEAALLDYRTLLQLDLAALRRAAVVHGDLPLRHPGQAQTLDPPA